MKHFIRATVAALVVAFATPAFAGGMTVAEDGDKKLKFESLFYLNTYAHKKTTGAVTSTDNIGLNVERAYFTLKYSFDPKWSMRFTTDMAKEALGKGQNIYLKYAYVEGKLAGDALDLRLGQSHTPWIDYEQHLWGHRYVAKVATDFFKYDDSSDLGIGLKGKLADDKVGYWVTATTGAGYGNGAGSTKGIDFNARVGVYPIEGLTLDAQYRNGYRGTKTFNALPAAITKSTLMQFMATYGIGKDFRVGANYITNKKDTNGSAPKDNGYSVWGTAKFAGNMGAFARYDSMTNKNAAGAKTATDSRITGGFEFSPVKGVTFALAFENRNTKPVAGTKTKETKAGLYSQIKL